MSVQRVLMTADAVGGVLSYAEDLCRGLSREGVHVMLAVMGGPLRADQRAPFDELANVLVEDSDYALEWMDEPWADVTAAGLWLLTLADRFDPDVVHLNGYAHAALAWRRPVLVVAHSCVASWFEAVKAEPLPFRFAVYERHVRAGLRAADAIVAPSAYMADAIERHYGPLARVRVIVNGIWTEDYSVSTKEPYVLAAGRLWDEAKNLSLLAGVAPRLPWPVVVAGELKRPQLPAGVTALGRLSRAELRDAMSRASIFVHAARYEPFGLAPLEAAASGCALVLSDIPTFRTLWSDASIQLPPEDSAALVAAIEELIRDGESRTALATNARERARRFHAQAMTNAYLMLYDELAGRTVRRMG
jgi:glycosyltransferase involved in cell wall biosynthesis